MHAEESIASTQGFKDCQMTMEREAFLLAHGLPTPRRRRTRGRVFSTPKWKPRRGAEASQDHPRDVSQILPKTSPPASRTSYHTASKASLRPLASQGSTRDRPGFGSEQEQGGAGPGWSGGRAAWGRGQPKSAAHPREAQVGGQGEGGAQGPPKVNSGPGPGGASGEPGTTRPSTCG